jgi:sugar phosphate permease
MIALPMLTIGTGISLPWGLMDGLAVSVVPKERAGMATGIFSTTRVAGEGVALAVVGAILSAITTAAQRLAAGDITMAANAMPGMDRVALVPLYSQAFSDLLLLLTGITLLTAIVVFIFLRTDAEETFEGEVEGSA